MNIFAIYNSPYEAAVHQCNAHVVKMPLESAQMLSLAHRVLDGTKVRVVKNNRSRNIFILSDEREGVLYQPTHVNHPNSIWCRETKANYDWLYAHFMALCEEYTRRYGKVHKSQRVLAEMLSSYPNNLPDGELTPFALTMPDEFKVNDPIQSYRAFYCSKQKEFKMVWTHRSPPNWFENIA